MKWKHPDSGTSASRHAGAFTLMELLVVLAILAALTTVALRSVDGLVDERRWEAARTGMEEIETAVLGSSDGTTGGFVADMGRLPRTTGTGPLELGELWQNPAVPFDIRPAVAAHGVAAGEEDPQVLVAGGWRGPYLRLRSGATTLLDGWGNPVTSPATASPPEPLTSGYARLRSAADAPIFTAGEEVRIIRLPGADGEADAADTGYDRNLVLSFSDDRFRASLSGTVEVRDGDNPAVPDPSQFIAVRLFVPDPGNPAQIRVISQAVPFTANPQPWSIPQSAGAVIGEHSLRAYRLAADQTTRLRVSEVRRIRLRPGASLVNFTIDRAP